MLLDISGSMAVGGNMDRAREAVAVATMNLRSGKDEAALFTFDSRAAGSRRLHQGTGHDSQGQPEGQAVGTDLTV